MLLAYTLSCFCSTVEMSRDADFTVKMPFRAAGFQIVCDAKFCQKWVNHELKVGSTEDKGCYHTENE